MSETSRERHVAMLRAIAAHARNWEDDARLLGNLRAVEIGDACEWAAALRAPLDRELRELYDAARALTTSREDYRPTAAWERLDGAILRAGRALAGQAAPRDTGDGFRQMSAEDEADAERVAALLRESYGYVLTARNEGGEWCVLYKYRLDSAPPEGEEVERA